MVEKIEKLILLVIVTVLLGLVAGAVCWTFFFLMNNGIYLIWEALPEALGISGMWMPLIVCVLGGFLVGLFQKKWPGQPQEMDEVLGEVKASGRYEYQNIGVGFVGALVPLLFGGCLGPEAGLTGVIAGLCTWVGDRLRFLGKEFQELSSVGIAAVITAVFDAPLFGLAVPIFGNAEGELKDDTLKVPKPAKIAVYLLAIASALGSMMGLGLLLGGMGGLPHYSNIEIEWLEIVLLIPCALAGAVVGWLFHAYGTFAKMLSEKIGDKPVIKAVIAGIALGALGVALPYTMFAGEIQAEELDGIWLEMGAVVLILTALVKPFCLQFCLNMGWRGGKFFPMIFCGISLGYGIAYLSGADPVFCLCACTAGALGTMMRQPLMATLLLFLCFPFKSVFVLLLAAVVGSVVPVPRKWLA